jgi:hypothetical protein
MNEQEISKEQYANWKAPGTESKESGFQLKLENLKGFKPSGDIYSDYNRLLELTDRQNLYQKVTSADEPEAVLAGLTAIRDSWAKTLRDPSTIDQSDSAKRIFYVDIPNQEIEAANRTINFYMENLSKKQ